MKKVNYSKTKERNSLKQQIMAKKYTRIKHEKHLNELYKDMYSRDQAYDEFQYLCNKERMHFIMPWNLWNYIDRGTMGTLLRKYDPIAFNTSYNDKLRE